MSRILDTLELDRSLKNYTCPRSKIVTETKLILLGSGKTHLLCHRSGTGGFLLLAEGKRRG